MMRLATSLLTISILLLLPALCAGGMLAHPCGGDASSGGECGHDCGHDSGCRHGGDCADDPCGGLIARPEWREGGPSVMPPTSTVLADLLVIDALGHTPASPPVWPESGHRPNLPFPYSDIPLLI